MSNLFEVISEDEFNAEQDSVTGVDNGEAGVGYVPDGLPTDTYPCDFCGNCETPNDCAWAHTCPKCGAPPGRISTATYCKHPQGGIVGLHAERWL